MARYIVSRIGQMVITMFIVSLLVFFMIRLKGDPITIMAPPHFNEEQVEALRRAWGFDKPLAEQYWVFITKAVTGDFGKSMSHNTGAMGLVMGRLKLTYLLAGVSAIIGRVIAVPLGVLSALYRNSPLDVTVSALASLGTAMPNFWLGLMLIIVFSVQLRWFPVFGHEGIRSLVLPATCLGSMWPPWLPYGAKCDCFGDLKPRLGSQMADIVTPWGSHGAALAPQECQI